MATLNHKPGDHQATVTLEVTSVAELSSAQQRMSTLHVSRIRLHNECYRCSGVTCKLDLRHERRQTEEVNRQEHNNGQQSNTMRTLSFPVMRCASTDDQTDTAQQPPPIIFLRILNALRQGNNRIVLREWRQGACWWNLNMNQDSSFGDHEVENKVRGVMSVVQVADQSCTQSCNTGSTQTTLSMARAEVAGYRLSRFAMDSYHDFDISTTAMAMNLSNNLSDGIISDDEFYRSNDTCAQDSSTRERKGVFMPEVLYFSHDDDNFLLPPVLKASMQSDESSSDGGSIFGCNNAPWALLSFFDNEAGHDADRKTIQRRKLDVIANYENLGMNGDLENMLAYKQPINSITNTNMNPPTKMDGRRIPCYHFPTTMIKIRNEFGFNEPHPRHGRVPTDECLGYASIILRDLIMPIQSSFFMLQAEGLAVGDSYPSESLKYNKDMMSNLLSVGWSSGGTVEPFQYHDMIAVYRRALHRLSMAYGVPGTNENEDNRMDFLLQMLDKCVDALNCEWEENGGRPPTLPPVLCHMDLQPQNLAFHNIHQNERYNSDGNQAQTHSIKYSSVAAVMDWEEACYADPRFELLLVCRKVLANREQSGKLWQSYSQCVQQLSNLLSSHNRNQLHWEVGPIEPWLRLETVHSLCTLLLQAIELLGGGRSPWESKPDLWGKIDRERQRLVQMGWLFCDYVKPVLDLSADL